MLTYGSILRRALTVGAVAGIALAAYTFLVIEPTIDDAIALEEAMSAAEHPAHGGHDHGDDPMFSRPEQVRGGLAAMVIYTLVAAGIFGTVFAAVRHRLPGRDDLGRAIWLAAMGFGALALMPAIKYPANPPAVGDPGTVGERTTLYLVLLVVSLLLMWGLTHLRRRLEGRLDSGTRVVVMTLATIVAFGTVLVVMPGTPDAIDPAVPADLVWQFRIRSLGGMALLWTALGVGIGWLVAHDAARAEQTAPTSSAA